MIAECGLLNPCVVGTTIDPSSWQWCCGELEGGQRSSCCGTCVSSLCSALNLDTWYDDGGDCKELLKSEDLLWWRVDNLWSKTLR